MSWTECVSVAVIEHQNCVLVGKRQQSQTLAGLAEFPGGKRFEPESSAEAAIRETLEETGLNIVPIRLLDQTTFSYDHANVEIDFWLCRLAEESLSLVPQEPWQWVPRHLLAEFEFPAANQQVVRLLISDDPTKSTLA